MKSTNLKKGSLSPLKWILASSVLAMGSAASAMDCRRPQQSRPVPPVSFERLSDLTSLADMGSNKLGLYNHGLGQFIIQLPGKYQRVYNAQMNGKYLLVAALSRANDGETLPDSPKQPIRSLTPWRHMFGAHQPHRIGQFKSGFDVIDITNGQVVYSENGVGFNVQLIGESYVSVHQSGQKTRLIPLDSKVPAMAPHEGFRSYNAQGTRYLDKGILWSSVHDFATGKHLFNISNPSGFSFSADGSSLWLGSGKFLRQLDATSGATIFEMSAPGKLTNVLKVSNDSNIVVAGYDFLHSRDEFGPHYTPRTLILNKISGKSVTWPNQGPVHMTSDGRYVVLRDIHQVSVYDTQSLEKVHERNYDSFENVGDAFIDPANSQLVIVVNNRTETLDLLKLQ